MKISAKKLFAAFGFLVCAAVSVAADYPTKPIKLVVPYAAGGTSEVLARGLARRLGEALGQPVVIENVGGAGSTLGTALVARSAPDGYTLLLGYNGGLTISPSFYSNIPYDPLKAFAPVRSIASFPLVMAAHSTVPANNVKELVALAKQKPGKLSYGTSGTGSGLHLLGEIFRTGTGSDILHVPYKGMAPALLDFQTGRVDLVWDAIDSLRGLFQQGKAKPLAVTSEVRLKELPDVPTVAEQGYPGLSFSAWACIVAPAGTPPDIVSRLESELGKILSTGEIRDLLESRGYQMMNGSAASLGKLMRDELQRYEKVVRAANAKITN